MNKAFEFGNDIEHKKLQKKDPSDHYQSLNQCPSGNRHSTYSIKNQRKLREIKKNNFRIL